MQIPWVTHDTHTQSTSSKLTICVHTDVFLLRSEQPWRRCTCTRTQTLHLTLLCTLTDSDMYNLAQILNYQRVLLTYTLAFICSDFRTSLSFCVLTYAGKRLCTKKPILTVTHTHAERAVLRCSIRLSMAIILISAKGKSLLWAARA